MASTFKLASAVALGVFALSPLAAVAASAAPAAQSAGTVLQFDGNAGTSGGNTGSGHN